MGTEFQWEGHSIQINSQPMLKYLWMATETVVKVDGVEIGRVGGFRFTEKINGTFINNDRPRELILEMKVDLITLISIPYKLQIDGNVISQGRLKINDWILFLVPIAIFTICVCCFATMALFFVAANNLSG